MEIIPAGTKAKTTIGAIEGILTAVVIREEALSYEFSYFLNGEYKEIWLREFQFTADEHTRISIGYR